RRLQPGAVLQPHLPGRWSGAERGRDRGAVLQPGQPEGAAAPARHGRGRLLALDPHHGGHLARRAVQERQGGDCVRRQLPGGRLRRLRGGRRDPGGPPAEGRAARRGPARRCRGGQRRERQRRCGRGVRGVPRQRGGPADHRGVRGVDPGIHRHRAGVHRRPPGVRPGDLPRVRGGVRFPVPGLREHAGLARGGERHGPQDPRRRAECRGGDRAARREDRRAARGGGRTVTQAAGTRSATGELASGRGRAGKRRAPNPDGIWPWVFVLPTLGGLAGFYFWPVIQTAYYSFTSWGVFGGAEFVGLENWIDLLQSGQVPRALVNTLVYTAMLLLGIPISIYIASLLNRPGLRFAAFYRVLFFAPFVSMQAAIALVWGMIFNSQYGILNQFLGIFGIPAVYWTSTEWVALVAIGIVGIWSSLGFNI